MPSCKYYFGKVFAHLAAALAVSAASAEYSNLGENLLGGTSKLIQALLSLGLLLGLLFATRWTKPGSIPKYAFFIAFAFWIGQAIKPYVEGLKDKGTLTRVLLLTSGVFAAMMALGFYDSGNFLGLGPYLLAGLLGLIITQALVLVLGTPEEKKKGIQWLNLFGVALFSLFTAYDIQVLRVNAKACKGAKKQGFEPDYPVESLGIYLDFISLFIRMDGDE